MSPTAKELLDRVLALPAADRDELTARLLDAVDAPGEAVSPEEWDAAWGEEIERRLAQVDSGEVQPLSLEESAARLRKAAGDTRG